MYLWSNSKNLSLRPADWRQVHFAALGGACGGSFLISMDFQSPNLPAQLVQMCS